MWLKLGMQLMVVINPLCSPTADFLCCLGYSWEGAALDTTGGVWRVIFAAGRTSLCSVRLTTPRRRWNYWKIHIYSSYERKRISSNKKRIKERQTQVLPIPNKTRKAAVFCYWKIRLLQYSIFCLQGRWALPIKIDKYMKDITMLILRRNDTLVQYLICRMDKN